MESRLPNPEELGATLVLHHWDADGVASASLILDWLGDHAELYVPPLGFYWLDSRAADEMRDLGTFDTLMVLDVALPVESVERAASAVGAGRVVLVDHHVRPRGRLPASWISLVDVGQPSASWHLTRLMGARPDLRSILGIAGDLGPTLRSHPVYGEVLRVLDSLGMGVEELERLAELVDANYRVGDREGVRDAVFALGRGYGDPRSLLSMGEWIIKHRSAEAEVERVLREARVEDFGSVVYVEFESPHLLISTVGRRFAWSRDRVAVLAINSRWRRGYAQVYSRVHGLDLDLTSLAEMARSSGYNAGGKRESVGVILPEPEAREFARRALDWLRSAVLEGGGSD